ncbi:pilin [Kangiella sp.]|uniref:pilin n=1 Tax=Kangiella sp. TaxID=1920245 RepID=UPI003A8F5AC8
MKRFVGAFAASLVLFVAACSDDKKETVKPADKPLVQAAWLQASLPDSTVAYSRVPTAWFLFTGQENGFKLAQNNQAHNQQVQAIQAALNQNILSHLEAPVDAVAKLFVEHMTSPLEVAFIQESAGKPMPVMVYATRFNFADNKAFNDTLVALTTDLKSQGIQHTANDDGTGSFSMPGAMARYQYDAKTQQFVMATGFATSFTVLSNVMESLKDNPQHAMQDIHNQIDSSGKGLFGWVNTKQVMPMLTMSLPPQQLEELKEYGLDQMNAIGFGYGVSEGKTRLTMLVDMPKVGIRDFIPAVNNDFDIKTVGTPRTMAMLSIPTYEEQVRLFNSINKAKGDSASLEELNRQVVEKLGFNLEQLGSVFGPELIYFRDDVGGFTATKVNDPELMQQMIDSLIKNVQGDYQVTKHQGKEIHGLTFKAMAQDDFADLSSATPLSFEKTFSKLNSRLYWTIENGYLIYSSVPQPLMERAKRKPNISLAEWVKEKQGQDVTHSLFAATTSVRDLSRNSYHYYLEALLMVADLTEADFDIMALPTADQMDFAEYGAVGFKLDSSDKYLGVEFTFEQSASDILFAGGGMQSAAVVGVLAAVAIPAYQDYTKRAKLVQATATANSLKSQVAYAQAMGESLEELDLGKHGIGADLSSAEAIEYVDVEDGVVTIYLNPMTFGNGYSDVYAKFEPIVEKDIIVGWNCDSNLDLKLRARICGL